MSHPDPASDAPINGTAQEQIVGRPSCGDADFWRVREFLVETMPVSPVGFNWNVRRWDGKRFYDPEPAGNPSWDAHVRLWENEGGRLVGAIFAEGRGDAHPQVHPAHRGIEGEMLTWAEAHLAAAVGEESRRLELFVYEYDRPRQQLLAGRGYEQMPYGGVTRRLQLRDHPLPSPVVRHGYVLRTTRPEDLNDCRRIADLLNAAFGRSAHNAQEYHNFTRLAPSFRPELDLVMEAPDGSLAAYVGVPYDESNRLGIFEPVCTHPDHRRQGLAQALMLEGLRRLHAIGAAQVLVDTGDMIPANRLYNSIGFAEVVRGFVWRKQL